MILRANDQLAGGVIRALKGGDLESLQRMLAANPGLSVARIKDDRGSKVLLHVVTDWPGFFPNPTFDTRLIIRVKTLEVPGFRGMSPIRSSLHSPLG
jgi:hypothetical protein